MKTRLVILIDFTKKTNGLIGFVKKWNEILDTDILLIHHLSLPLPVLSAKEERENLLKFEKNRIETVFSDFIKTNFENSSHVSFKILDKNLLTALPKYLGNEHNDILLLGRKEKSFIKKLLIGSFAKKIIEQLNYISISVPNEALGSNTKTLTVALTDEYPLNRSAFNTFLNSAGVLFQSIHFLSVITPRDNYIKTQNSMMNLSDKYNIRIPSSFELINADTAISGLMNYVSMHPETTLAVQKGARAISDQLFRKYFINQLIYAGKFPLIIIPSA
jgi:hypothetical protein